MKISFKKERGQLIPYLDEDFTKFQKMADGAVYQVEMKNLDTRTIKQNSAMHKYFSLIASELNDKGLTIAKTIKVETVWSMASVKEVLWKPIQEAVLKKKSTTELTKDELDKVYDVINMALGQRFGVHIPFPTIKKD